MDGTGRQSKGLRILPLALAVGAVLCTALTSCDDEKKDADPPLGNREVSPTMSTSDVETVISDSGYVRYKIYSPRWLVYGEAEKPRWTFPQGLHLDQLDDNGAVQASIWSDSATYMSKERLWRLDGNVVMVNRLRDSFLTQQLFWDQTNCQVYSDSFVHIVKQERIVEGYGFVSNQEMTQYTLRNPQGIIPVDKDRMSGTPPLSADTVGLDEPGQPARRPAPVRASLRKPTLQQAMQPYR